MTQAPTGPDAAGRVAAKVAGLAYIIPMVAIAYANFGMRGALLVKGDETETLRRIAAAQPLFRLSLAFDLLYCLGVVVLVSALYVLLSRVSRHLALLASALRLMHAATVVLTMLRLTTLLHLASDGAYAQAFGADRIGALVTLSSAVAWDQYYAGLAFWSLSSTLIYWLWLKSRYVPRTLAVAGIVSSAWCVLCTFAYLIDPAFARVVNLWWFDSPMALVDFALGGWLLFKGTDASFLQPSAAAVT
jgi:hypothetical protein